MGVIKVNKIKVHAFHGCMPEETAIGTNFEVNVVIETDFDEAAKNDDLSKTVDYVIVREISEREMAIPSKLIEHVAYRIKSSLINEIPLIDRCTVEVVKYNAPMGGDVESVSVVV